MKTEEIEKLAEKHGGTVIDYSLPEGPQTMDTTIIIATSELAALITEVRRQKGEEDAALCHAAFAHANWNPLLKNAAGVCADTIRARMEEGK